MLKPHTRIASASSPAEALARAEPVVQDCCSLAARTQQIAIINRSSFGIEIAFKQALSSFEPPNECYVANTGVYVGCMNVGPKVDCISDPCSAGGNRKAILGTTIKGSAKLVRGGASVTVNFPDLVAPAGKFFSRAGWIIEEEAEVAEGKAAVAIRESYELDLEERIRSTAALK